MKNSTFFSLLACVGFISVAILISPNKLKEAVAAVNPFGRKSIYDMSVIELDEHLSSLLEKEEYEEACLVRDELTRRKQVKSTV